MPDDEELNLLLHQLNEGVKSVLVYAVAAEQIVSLMRLLRHAAGEAERLHERDDELTPEIKTAMTHIGDAVSALKRAHDFASARMDVALDAESRGYTE